MYSTQLAAATGVLIIAVTMVFAFIQSPELLALPETAVTKDAGKIPHPIIEEWQPCAKCHGLKKIKPYPLRHAGWGNESCTKCHVPVDVTAPGVPSHETAVPLREYNKLAQPVPHPLKGMENCSGCHGPNGILPYPRNHLGWHDDICTRCHKFSVVWR